MTQTTFILEAFNMYTIPEWLVSVRKFLISKYSIFLENLFGPMLDLQIICDGLILYIIVCCPDKKDSLLSKKAVCACLVVVLGLSALIAILAAKSYSDINGPRGSKFGLGKLGLGSYAWIADISFRVIVSFSTAIFHLVFTLRIRITLKKSIRFLET